MKKKTTFELAGVILFYGGIIASIVASMMANTIFGLFIASGWGIGLGAACFACSKDAEKEDEE